MSRTPPVHGCICSVGLLCESVSISSVPQISPVMRLISFGQILYQPGFGRDLRQLTLLQVGTRERERERERGEEGIDRGRGGGEGEGGGGGEGEGEKKRAREGGRERDMSG